MHALFVRMKVKADCLDALSEVVSGVAIKARTEAGCIAFEPFRPADGSPAVMIYEKWADKADLDTHEAQQYMKDLFARVGGWLDGQPDVTVIELLAA